MNEATIELRVTPTELNIIKNLLSQKVIRMEMDNKNHGIEMDIQYLVFKQYIDERKYEYETA